MKIDIVNIDGGTIRLKEVYNSIILETSEGNQFVICMRDDGLELGIKDTSIPHSGPERCNSLKWFEVKNGSIKEMNAAACGSLLPKVCLADGWPKQVIIK